MESIGYLIMKVAKDLRYELSKEFDQYGLTPAQWAVIKNIDIKETHHSSFNERTSKFIAKDLDFDKPTVSGIIARLEDKNMIFKQHHPQDKRSFTLNLTIEAKNLIPLLEEASERVVQRALVNFSQEQSDQFINLLKIMESTVQLHKEE
ncbi:MarR family winged helix-turn-helix transcriptional regulator [Paenibacillus sp. CMAA1364]